MFFKFECAHYEDLPDMPATITAGLVDANTYAEAISKVEKYFGTSSIYKFSIREYNADKPFFEIDPKDPNYGP